MAATARSPINGRQGRRRARRGHARRHEDAEDFIDEYGLSYPILKDNDGHGIETFGVVQYPETFVIDRDGRITAVRRGPMDERFMRTEVGPQV